VFSRRTSIRLDRAVVARLDTLAVKISRPGRGAVRSEAIRAALVMGLRVIEAERGLRQVDALR